MDYFHRATVKNYTAWDIKCRYVKNDKALEKAFKRAARRKLKRELKEETT